MQQSVSHQQLVKALSFGLNTNSQTSLQAGQSIKDKNNTASMTDLNHKSNKSSTAQVQQSSKSGDLVVNIEDHPKDKQFISLKQQLKN